MVVATVVVGPASPALVTPDVDEVGSLEMDCWAGRVDVDAEGAEEAPARDAAGF